MTEHFDQISPVDGVHQLNPDGTVTPVLSEQQLDIISTPKYPGPDGPGVDSNTGKEHAILLDEGPVETPAVQPPTLPPVYDDDMVTSVLAQVDQQRAQLAQPAGNIDIHGAPHFQRSIDGVDVCGQCAQPWPCVGWQQISQALLVEQGGTNPQSGPVLLTLEEAAAAAGMDPAEFSDRLRAR